MRRERSLLELAMTHWMAPFQTDLAAHRIRMDTQARAGWISYLLLLMALTGCRVPSARTDPPTTSCTKPDPPNASAVASPNAAFGCNQTHHGPPGPSEVSEGTSEDRRTRRRGAAAGCLRLRLQVSSSADRKWQRNVRWESTVRDGAASPAGVAGVRFADGCERSADAG